MRHFRLLVARILTNVWIPVLCLVLFLAGRPAATAQNTVYAIANTGVFGTLNLSTGTFTQTGNCGSTLAGLGSLGANLYGGLNHGGTLYQVNLASNNCVAIGNGSITYLGFGSTTAALYGLDTNLNLYSVNSANGSVTLIGVTGIGSCSVSTSMSADGSALYATCDNGSGSVLYSVNTTTGAATAVGNTGVGDIDSMVFTRSGLYAATGTGQLYTLNPITAMATFVATTGQDISGMALPASTFSLLHRFTNGQDGGPPAAGLTMDRAGNLYGTASAGGNFGDGTVFKLTLKSSGWVFGPLYEFQGGGDGAAPEAPVTIGADGSLYGTTNLGGSMNDGTVYRLRPQPTSCEAALCFWSETQLYAFGGSPDGVNPGFGGLIFDSAGNLYGTTIYGGSQGEGAAYELLPSGGGWTENIIHSFGGNGDGTHPYSGLIFDSVGNLYGTTYQGSANGYGAVYQFTLAGNNWTEGILYAFEDGGGNPPDGAYPYGSLIIDALGNFYGTTSRGGSGGGTVFQLTPANGGWNLTTIYDIAGTSPGPYGGLVLDAAGNLYGTTNEGGFGYGTVFKLTPSNGSWLYTELYDFTDGLDGAYPYGSLVLDATGNLYGTTSGGGNGYGTVFEVTPN